MPDTGLSTAFPLHDVTDSQLRALCRALWDWELCEDCTDGRPCLTGSCPWQRSERLEPFFQLYRRVTSTYVPDFFGDQDQALRGHGDLLDIISLLRRKGSSLSREECMHDYFTGSRGIKPGQLSASDQARAFDLAVRITTMVGGAADSVDVSGSSLAFGELGPPPYCTWQPEQCLDEFIAATFPMRTQPTLQDGDTYAEGIKENLTCARLRKAAGLKVEGTDDLRNHLKLDQRTGRVQVFHYTSVLKEHLLATERDVRQHWYGTTHPLHLVRHGMADLT